MKAPYFDDIARAAAPCICEYRKTKDGVRLRIAAWTGGKRGTIFLLNGRTEFIEKYAHIAKRLLEKGYSVVSLDWRGQGLSDRLLDDKILGHICKFEDYQRDLDTAFEFITAHDLPKPTATICHSLSGAIVLRAHLNGKPLGKTVFFSPMFHIYMGSIKRRIAKHYVRLALNLGMINPEKLVPTMQYRNASFLGPFAKNELTSDRNEFDRRKKHYEMHPELEVGGPTVRWTINAFDETAELMATPALREPSMVVIGKDERIVSHRAAIKLAKRWKAKLLDLPDAQHELMIEGAEIQDQIWPEVEKFLMA